MFEFDPSSIQAGFEVFPKDTYKMEITELKFFKREGKIDTSTGNKKDDPYGVNFNLKIIGGDSHGKTAIFNGNLHSEGARKFTKQIMIAAAGFSIKEEKAFDTWATGKDWKIQEDGTLGSGWNEFVNKVIECDLDTKADKDTVDLLRQKWGAIRPSK